MAFNSYRKNFKGTLSDIDIKKLAELDFTKEKLSDRKKYIDEKYQDVIKFYNDYIFGVEGKQFFKVGLNSSDDLSEEINVFKCCERDATYLLNSRDVQRDKEYKYTFLNEEEFREILKREKMLTSLECEEGVFSILEPKQTNDYSNMDHKIKKEDFEDVCCGEVLKEYEIYRNYLKTHMEKIKNKEESPHNLYQLRRLLKGINDDMIKSKIALKGIRGQAKKLGDESGMFYTDVIDYKNEKHIKAILKNVKFGELHPDSDLSHIAYDMECAINKLYKDGKFDELDLEIIDCYNSGYSERDISKELNRAKTTINQRLNKIFKRISHFFKKN